MLRCHNNCVDIGEVCVNFQVGLEGGGGGLFECVYYRCIAPRGIAANWSKQKHGQLLQ